MAENKKTKGFEEIVLIASKASKDAESAQKTLKELIPLASQAFSESRRARTENGRIRREQMAIRREQKNSQFKVIEILTIFVAVIGFLFGAIQFISKFSFLETFALLLTLGFILGGFCFLIDYLFAKLNY